MALTPSASGKRRPVNLTINSALVAAARQRGLNLSQLAEQAIANVLSQPASPDWQQENQAALTSYRRRFAKRGAFSDGLRRF